MSLTRAQEKVLQLTAAAVFGRETPTLDGVPETEIFKEALEQAVLPLVSSKLESKDPETQKYKKLAQQIIVSNIRVEYEHTELEALLSNAGIAYVCMKGVASAMYYPEPILRHLGDVDFLVDRADVLRAGEVLEQNGFSTEDDTENNHIAYSRGTATWELHHAVNGIPKGEKGAQIRRLLKDCVSSAKTLETGTGKVRVPDAFCHGMILLIHTASHMITSGVGLRHLCDWAAFAASMTNDEFVTLFEEPLKCCGLWRFAQLLTLCSIRYLGMPVRAWAGVGDDSLLEQLICDIMSGGNFGQKGAGSLSPN